MRTITSLRTPAALATLLLLAPLAAADGLLGPSPPQGLTATAGAGAGEISLSWQPAASILGVSGYRVWRGDAPGAYALVAELPADALSHVDAGLAPGTTYHYVVTAHDAVGESAWSNEASATTFALPDAPQDLRAAPGAGPVGEVALSWAAPASDGGTPVTGYVVYRDGAPVAMLDAATLSWTDSGLTPFHAYAYAVAAVNLVGEGAGASACGMASPWVATPGAECMTVL